MERETLGKEKWVEGGRGRLQEEFATITLFRIETSRPVVKVGVDQV